MTRQQALAAAGLATACAFFALAMWASTTEHDAPGWRSHTSVAGCAITAALLGAALT